jgi:hypothetical protein
MAIDNVTSKQGVEDKLRRGCADMTALCHGNLGAAVASSQAAICGAQEVNAVVLAFLQSRAKDGLAASQQLTSCHSPEAALEVQLDYFRAMLQAYTDELGRLQALTGKVLTDVVTPLTGRAMAVAETGVEALAA